MLRLWKERRIDHPALFYGLLGSLHKGGYLPFRSVPDGDTTSQASCGIITTVEPKELSGRFRPEQVQNLTPGRLVGLQGRLERPYWGVLGGWAALCGALASNQLRWDGQVLLSLALVLILADLAWGTIWDLATGTDWFRLLAEDWSPSRRVMMLALPYTQPGSPGAKISLSLGWFAGWWRSVFWPAAGSALLGLLAAVLLAVVLSLALPARLRLLSAALVALVGLGVAVRKQGKEPLAGQALVQVGLSWLAGTLVFAEMGSASLALALVFAIAAWGALRAGIGLAGGKWLLNGGVILSIVLMVAMKQPLAAGLMGLLFFGQVALQISLLHGDGATNAQLRDRTGPWLMAIMLVAALAVP